MRVPQDFRSNFKPLVVTRSDNKHSETPTGDARELCCSAQVCVSIIPRAAAVSQQLTQSPGLISLPALMAQERGDNMSV